MTAPKTAGLFDRVFSTLAPDNDAYENWEDNKDTQKRTRRIGIGPISIKHTIFNPYKVDLPDLDEEQKKKRDAILKRLIDAGTGDPSVDFVQKRAALQTPLEKRAAPLDQVVRKMMRNTAGAPKTPGVVRGVLSRLGIMNEADTVRRLRGNLMTTLEGRGITPATFDSSNPTAMQNLRRIVEQEAPLLGQQEALAVKNEALQNLATRATAAQVEARSAHLEAAKAQAMLDHGVTTYIGEGGVRGVPAKIRRGIEDDAKRHGKNMYNDTRDAIKAEAELRYQTMLHTPMPGTAGGSFSEKNPVMSTGLKWGLGSTALIGGSALGVNHLFDPTAQRKGFAWRSDVYPNIMERLRLDEEAADSFANSIGKELGKKTVGLLGDVLSKTVSAPGDLVSSMQRKSVFSQLKTEDDVIARAEPQQLDEAYHTMVRFAPTLATDKNAVKTFLRESVLYGTGPNFVAIKQLADAERAVNVKPNVVVKKD